MKRRLTAVLLLVCMLLTMLPVGTMAEEGSPDVALLDSSNEGGTPPPCDHTWQDATCTAPKTCLKCGATEGAANGHTWQDATCAAGKTCTVCGASEGSPAPHSWGAWTIDDNTHNHTCTACGAAESGSHNYGSWAPNGSTHTKACLECGKTVSAEHNFGTAWVSNGDGTHSHVCADCGGKSAAEACVIGTPATCKEPAKCKECGGSIGEVSKVHDGVPTYTSNHNGTHTATYSGCGHTVTENCEGAVIPCKKSVCAKCHEEYGEENHTKAGKPRPVAGKAAHEDYCSLCKKSLGNETACTQTPKSNGDGTHDMVCNVCDGTLATGIKCAYDPNTAVCSQKPVCKTCGAEYGTAPLGHDIGANGCTRPGCDCAHPDLWTSDTPGTCKECKKTFQKTAVAVNFTVNGYGIGKRIADLTAAPNAEAASAVSNVTVSAAPNTGTFQNGTAYTITVAYAAVPGYAVTSASINGKGGTPGSGTVSVSMGQPEVVYSILYYNMDGVTVKGSRPTEYTASSLPLTLTDDVSKPGCTFNGWVGTTTSTPKKNLTIPKGTVGNLAFSPSFTVIKHKVTYNAGGYAANPADAYVEDGKLCPYPKCKNATMILAAWQLDGKDYDFSKPVTKPMNLTARWEQACMISYDNYAFGLVQYTQAQAAAGINLSTDVPKPQRSGYYFVGWRNAAGQVATGTLHPAPGETIHVYAKWSPIDRTNPKTGDSRRPELAAGILAFSTLSLGAAITLRKKKRFF